MTTTKQLCMQLTNGLSSDLFNVSTSLGSGLGVIHNPLKWFYVYPATPNTQLVASLQSNFTAGSYLTLNFPDQPFTINGLPVVTLDCLRMLCLNMTLVQNVDFTFLINGYDEQQKSVQEELTYEGLDLVPQNGTRGFKYISSIQCTALTGTITQPVSFGTCSVIALPEHALLSNNQIIQCSWGNTFYPVPTFVTPAWNWRTDPFNNQMTDARGMVTLPSAPNGTTIFTIYYYVYGADSELQSQLMVDNASAQAMVPALILTPPAVRPNLPVLINYDETGMQYPADLPAYQEIFVGT